MKLNWEKYGLPDFGYGRGNKKAFCPKCHDTRHNKGDRSLSVNLATGEFLCHYCGFSGCAAEDDEWMSRKTIKKSAPAYKKPAERPMSQFSDKMLKYFAGRGISEKTLVSAKVGEGMEWMPQKQKQCNTVQFNYYLDGDLVNTKFRTGDKCFKMVHGARLIPYNIDAIRDTKECIITEGEMDALSFIECGRTDVVSVPNGANANLEFLDDFMEDIFEKKEVVYVASDNDQKGLLLRNELVRRFGSDVCRIVDYSEGCKDANEELQRHGKESLMQCLTNAKEVKVEGVFTVSDFEDSLDYIFENGLQKGYTIGFDNFDKLCSFETRRLCIVTGIPGSGKSEFIDQITELLNMRYGWRFAYFSPENAPLSYHASKLIEKFTGKKFSKQTLPPGEYAQVKRHLEKDFFFISPPNDFKIDTILDKAKSLVRRKGIKCLVIDPYNRIESEQGTRSETLYISQLLDKLTNFANMNDVLVILMAHPTKMPKNKEGVIEAPTLYDISGSANFFNKADFGIVVHRDRLNGNVQVIVSKVKFRHLGECGMALFRYNINNGRYTPEPEIPGDPIAWDNSNHLTETRHEADSRSQTSLDMNTWEAEDYPEPLKTNGNFNCPF